MNTLHKGFAGSPRRYFLPEEKGRKRSFTTSALPGVNVHILGPSRDPKIIRDMDPPDGHSYLRFAGDGGRDEKVEPFRSVWNIDPRKFHYPYLKLDAQTIHALRKQRTVDALAVARGLEASVNGTSLMLMFQIGRAHLLFTGDAQWGTWNAAIQDSEWRDLLKQTTFLKVGHHGSHNATPTDFVELLSRKALRAAMVCTRSKVKQWDIPRKQLLKKLKEKTPNVARSDVRPPRGGVFDPGENRIDYQATI
jgi:hypothetical protein